MKKRTRKPARYLDLYAGRFSLKIQQFWSHCISQWWDHTWKTVQWLRTHIALRTKLWMFPELKDLPYLQRLAKLHLWSLEESRNRANLIEIFKMIKGFSSVSWSHIFTRIESEVTRGQNWKLMKKGVRSDLHLHCFFLTGWLIDGIV